jgi:Fe-S cluster assembly ATP-binding protein
MKSPKVTSCFNGESILELDPAERAAKGIFLAFQYPVEIPGVATMQFLKVAMNEQRKARGEAELTTPEFIKRVKAAPASCRSTWICCASAECRFFRRREEARRDPADGAALQPSTVRSRRNRFRPRHRRAEDRRRGRQCAARQDRAIIVITHYQRLLDYIVPDSVHVLYKGQIIKSGPKELAHELEANGYADIIGEAA